MGCGGGDVVVGGGGSEHDGLAGRQRPRQGSIVLTLFFCTQPQVAKRGTGHRAQGAGQGAVCSWVALSRLSRRAPPMWQDRGARLDVKRRRPIRAAVWVKPRW